MTDERSAGPPSPDRPRHARPADDRTAEAAAASAETWFCDLCGAPMLDLHCKLVCERCGYKRDCSDP